MEQRPVDKTPGIQASSPVGGKGRAGKARRAQQAAQAPQAAPKPGAEKPAGSPAFHVLLERLSRSARELQENTDVVERPSDLADAVGRAKASLDDALALGDRLLEAWRAERTTQNPDRTER